MAEYEELRLIVTLDDKASVGLAKVRNEIEKLHGGSTGGVFDKVNKYTKDFSTSLRLVTEQTIDLTKSLGPVGMAFGGVAAGVLAAGVAFYNVGKQLKSFSEATLSLSTMARTLGILPGQFKALSDQLARVMSKETADKNVLEFGKTMQEFGRIGSEAKAEWIRAAGGGADAITLIEQVTGLARGGQLDQAMQLYIDGVNASYQKNRKSMDEGGVGEQQAAYQRRQMLERAGLSVEVLELRERLKAATQKQIDDEEERLRLAKDFNKEWNETIKALNNFKKTFIVEILPVFNDLNVSINTSSKDWGTGLGKFVHDSADEAKTLYTIIKETIDLLNSTPASAFEKIRAAQGRVNPRTTQPYHTAPRMQHGGLVTRPTMALIGEAGPEAVVPLSSGGMNANMLRGGYANMPLSQNIEDRRGKQLEENTEQLRELNKMLTEEKYGALSTGSYGTGGSMTGAGAGPGGTSSGPGSGTSGTGTDSTAPTTPPALAVPGKEGGGVTYGAGDSPALGTPTAAAPPSNAGALPGARQYAPGALGPEAGPTSTSGGGAEMISNLYAPFRKELEENPETKRLLGGIVSAENPGAGPAVAERLFNRTLLVNQARAKKGLPRLTLKDMIMGHPSIAGGKSFYSPIRSGAIKGHMANAEKMFPQIDLALSGSFAAKGYTDQGSSRDPNYAAGGYGVNINRERFNNWGYAGAQAFSDQLRKDYAAAEAKGTTVQATPGAAPVTGGGAAGNPPKGPYYGQDSGYGSKYGGGTTADAGPGGPGGDPRLTTVGKYTTGGDPRRDVLIAAAREASKNLPPGYKVEAYSGSRTGKGQGPHAGGGAIDFRIIGPDGKELPNYQNPKFFPIYEKFAQDTHLALQKLNPQLAALHRWGGYFSGRLGQNPATGKDWVYGAMDTMHQDFAGGDSRMAGGKWDTGVDPNWGKQWGVGRHSLADSRAELDRMAAEEAKRKIEGTASVKVNVRYTSPKHKSPVFKDVPMERPTQMQKADDGKQFGQASLESSGAV